jgi:chromosome segregation ATPase
VLLQLRFKLRRERQKKAALLKRLGARAWEEDLHLEGAEAIRGALRELHERRNSVQLEWKNAFIELERTHKRLEEGLAFLEDKFREQSARRQPLEELLKRKREEERNLKKLAGSRDIERLIAETQREVDETRARLDESDRERREIVAEAREERREIEKEIHFWRRKKKKIQDQIKEIEARQEEFFHSLGELLEERRHEAEGLAGIYGEIDLANQRIATLQHRIETLSGG